MKKYFYTSLFCLFVSYNASACSCTGFVYFCEAVTENSHVVRGKILNKYEIDGGDEFIEKFYMDVLILENILGDLAVDTISIVNSNTSCDMFHDDFEIGAEVILNDIDENRIDDFSGHPYVSPGGCSSSLLFLNDGIVQGGIRSDLKSQPFDEFKSEIGPCSKLTALDRWIKEINENLYIFPNPSQGDIFVMTSFQLEEEVSYELYDAVGKLMQEGLMDLNNQFNLGIKHYPKGTYFLKLNIRDQSLTKKILKN